MKTFDPAPKHSYRTIRTARPFGGQFLRFYNIHLRWSFDLPPQTSRMQNALAIYCRHGQAKSHWAWPSIIKLFPSWIFCAFLSTDVAILLAAKLLLNSQNRPRPTFFFCLKYIRKKYARHNDSTYFFLAWRTVCLCSRKVSFISLLATCRSFSFVFFVYITSWFVKKQFINTNRGAMGRENASSLFLLFFCSSCFLHYEEIHYKT